MKTNAPDLSRNKTPGGFTMPATRNIEARGRAVRAPWAALMLAVLVCALAAVTQEAEAQPVGDALILLRTNDGTELNQTVQEISGLGARVSHVFPSQVLIGQVPETAEAAVRAHPAVMAIHRTAIEPPDRDGLADEAALGVGVWNRLINPPAVQAAALADPGAPLTGDAFHAPDALPGRQFQAPGGDLAGSPPPAAHQTSEFMIGSITVGIILPESSGNGENWSGARQDQVIQEIVAGCNWWATRGGASAHLTFFYDVKRSVPTQYEPIQRPYSDERLWIAETLEHLGYPGANYFTQCRAYDNALRDRFRSDWAFTVFVVDSLNDADGKFSDSYFAYAYLNGPFMVMTYDNNGYGIGNTDVVMAHEMGHIFGALDEYSGASSCNERWGYLDIPNGNHAQCASPVDGSCVMRGGIRWSLCSFSHGQIGWRDSDADGLHDPADTAPILTTAVNTTGNSFRISGAASDVAYPSPTRTPCTLNTLLAVEYRLNGDAWLLATADDGSFNTSEERFHFTVGPLAGGTHTVETRVRNSVGNVGTTTTILMVTAPEIEVLLGGSGVADGQTTSVDFGRVFPGQPGSTKTFTVRNVGGQTLTLGGVSVPAGFSLTEGLASNLAPGQTDTFTVSMETVTVGIKAGQIIFASNDSDENPFNFPITGVVLPPPSLVHVDGASACLNPDGSAACPFKTFCEGYDVVATCGTVPMRAGSYAVCRRVLTKCAVLESGGGRVTLTGPSPGETAPGLSAPARQADGTFALRFNGEIGRRYQVFTSTNLVAWELWKDFTAETTAIDLVDTDAASTPARFFRVTMPE